MFNCSETFSELESTAWDGFVVSVVETKVCLVVLRTKSCGNLSSNDDVDPGTGGVEEAHHHGETEAGHGGVACKSLLANENAF